MTKKELFKSINELCLNLDYKYDINNGGCCFVAAVIAQQLENYNIPYEVYEYFSPCHYIIKVSDRCLNNPREYYFRDKYIMEDYNSSKLFKLYYEEDWNEKYSRKWNLIVETKLKSLFRKYGNHI